MKVLLITGKEPGHNLFPVKELLQKAGHQVEIALLLQVGQRMSTEQNVDIVLAAKEPCIEAGLVSATFERTLMALDTIRARKPQVRFGMISDKFVPQQIAILGQRGYTPLLISELQAIKNFVDTAA